MKWDKITVWPYDPHTNLLYNFCFLNTAEIIQIKVNGPHFICIYSHHLIIFIVFIINISLLIFLERPISLNAQLLNHFIGPLLPLNYLLLILFLFNLVSKRKLYLQLVIHCVKKKILIYFTTVKHNLESGVNMFCNPIYFLIPELSVKSTTSWK